MREFVVGDDGLEDLFDVMMPLLDERQRRLMAGTVAWVLGRGGPTAVAETTGMSRNTVLDGQRQVVAGQAVPTGRVRAPGGGRPRLVDLDPGLVGALEDLVDPGSRGDPMRPLRWTSKSTAKLADELTATDHPISPASVGLLLHDLGYSLQAPAKENEGRQHPDRDGQFDYLNGQVVEHQAAGQPVISVDTKKKELVGDRFNGGQEWQPVGSPVRVDVHDFPDPNVPKAVPYGVYDIAADQAWVSVGRDGDTAAFAVATIGRWWDEIGRVAYPEADRLLITADAGGSNSYRGRLWKHELAGLAARTGLAITVCHYPPGTSKWNRIEHRLFSAISQNWRGRPLTSHEVIVDLIANTTSRTGLNVRAALDTGTYPTGIKISDRQLATIPLARHEYHGEWNYTIKPNSTIAR